MIRDFRNNLLGRREVTLTFSTQGPTPSRKQVLSLIASALHAPEDRIVIKEIKQEYGETVVVVTANVYDDAATLKRVEYQHYLKRLEGKKEGQQAPAGQAPAQEAK